jgi:glutathione S-transferase
MHLYHSPGSRSARVLWALEEIGVPYDVTVLVGDERRGAEHRKRHPLGRVPVIELDDGRLLFESAAICLYLGDLYPDAGIAPAVGSPERPLLYQWVLFAMTELEPTVIRWSIARRKEESEEEHSERFAELAPVVTEALNGQEWLLGESFSIADIISARVLSVVFNRELTSDYPELSAYTARALARPAHIRADAISRD